MSNWQNPQFNLNAPEFVPKFGGGPSPPQNQNRNMPPHQQQQNAMGASNFPSFPPGVAGVPHQFNQLSPQQQQQFYNHQPPQYRHPPPPQQQQQQQQPFNNYQQSHYQHPQQFYYNANPLTNPNQQQQHSNVQQLNQVTNNLAKLTTNSSVSPPQANEQLNNIQNTQQQNATESALISAPTPAPVPAPAAVIPPVVEAPVVTIQSQAEPSVLVEKPSVPPSEATIKEDEEWEDGNKESTGDVTDKQSVGGGEAAGGSEGAESAAKAQKKQIVIREYKPRKEPINVIFCGHVDAGKSTIGGQIMYLTGMVDKRTLEKYEREAKEKNRESWYLSWALDTNIEEREKGKTVEVGRAFFETDKKHFIILDAPGHRGFVPNMIGGASQADIAVLVISARRGEFETGFERGGQTREHAMLVKTAGVKYLIVLVNKMDDTTVNWDQARYDDIKEKLTPYLKKCGFQPNKDTFFMPCSGYTGAFIKELIDESICPWYRGPCFIEFLESLPTMNRTTNGPVRMPLIDKYKDMGTVVMGKIESGMVRLNDKLCVMPNKIKVEVSTIYCEEDETDSAICGENVKLKLKGIEEEEISSGSVLCDLKETCQVARVFDAQVIILECPSIICAGFNSILHIHAATAEVQLKGIIGMVDKKTGEKDLKNRPRFIKQDQISICRFEVLNGAVICMEPFKLFPQLGRFTLRYENKTVAVGKVLKVIE